MNFQTIIDLPKSAYTITDKPTFLIFLITQIIAFLDAFGWLVIDSTMALGKAVEWLIDTGINTVTISATKLSDLLTDLVGLFVPKLRVYAL